MITYVVLAAVVVVAVALGVGHRWGLWTIRPHVIVWWAPLSGPAWTARQADGFAGRVTDRDHERLVAELRQVDH